MDRHGLEEDLEIISKRNPIPVTIHQPAEEEDNSRHAAGEQQNDDCSGNSAVSKSDFECSEHGLQARLQEKALPGVTMRC